MNHKVARFLSALCFALLCLSLLPIPTLAQCQDQRDQLCRNLQYVLYAAETDFREFRGPKAPNPDVSVGGAKVPCQISTWANNVAMYMCYGQVPLAAGQEWYTRTLGELQRLQYLWHFKVESAATDHYVDAGPPDCEVPPADGPYLGQCPLHLQAVKQPDGTAKVYMWVNSYTSPYLVHKPPSQAPQKQPPSP